MSIRLEVAYQDLLKRIEALEMKEERHVIPISKDKAKPNGKLTPKHLMFGKWGLADENGEMVDTGPYSKDAAIKAAEMAS